jgi:AcrR family transcriptional regulator
VAIRDVREQLFDAAERVLLRDGPHALTSRAVTTEAGCAKGVLHKHFADFDSFLAELIFDRIGRLEVQAAALRAAAGAGTVADNLTGVLMDLFTSVAAAMLPLIIFRDDLRARLRQAGVRGVPVQTQAMQMIIEYLGAERDLGRLAPGADPGTLALTLVGTAQMLYADKDAHAPDAGAVRKFVTSVIASALPERSR